MKKLKDEINCEATKASSNPQFLHVTNIEFVKSTVFCGQGIYC